MSLVISNGMLEHSLLVLLSRRYSHKMDIFFIIRSWKRHCLQTTKTTACTSIYRMLLMMMTKQAWTFRGLKFRFINIILKLALSLWINIEVWDLLSVLDLLLPLFHVWLLIALWSRILETTVCWRCSCCFFIWAIIQKLLVKPILQPTCVLFTATHTNLLFDESIVFWVSLILNWEFVALQVSGDLIGSLDDWAFILQIFVLINLWLSFTI